MGNPPWGDRLFRSTFSTPYKAVLSFILVFCLVIFVLRTWHWPLVGDAPLMHYVVFLMDHGMAPYRTIVDINMPGAYFFESLILHFGSGGLALRLFDLFTGLVCAGAMVLIAWPYDRFAGFLAGALFILLHGRDGLDELGQRDLVMAALLLVAYVFLFRVTRSAERSASTAGSGRLLVFSALFGFFLGAAVTVKPTPVLLMPPLIALFCFALHRRRAAWLPHLFAACAGFLLPLGATLVFLLHERALAAFLSIVFRLIPAHADLHRRTFGWLFAHTFAATLLPFVLLWIPVAVFAGRRRNWETGALVLGVLFGLASFYVQAKGYSYHRYPAEVFLLLLFSIDFSVLLSEAEARGPRWLRPFAALMLGAAVVVLGIGSMRKAIEFDWRDQQFNRMLRADLTRLGGPALDHHVQCMDMAAGCLDVLYRMRLVQATGFLYDCYVLDPAKDDGGYRRKFWNALQANPPEVFVVTSHTCSNGPRNYDYRQFRTWPRFNRWIAGHYSVYTQRIPSEPLFWSGEPGAPYGYRIYVRDGFRTASTTPEAHTSGAAAKSASAKSRCMRASALSP